MHTGIRLLTKLTGATWTTNDMQNRRNSE